MNNNLTLVNTNVSIKDKTETWSLMIYRLQYFKVCYALILPFTPQVDERGIVRYATTFKSIKRDCKVYCRVKNEFLDALDRSPVIDGLIKHLRTSFGWNDDRDYRKYKIFRYRMLAVLSTPGLIISKDIDVHHISGLDDILSGIDEVQTIDDRSRNLRLLTRDNHSSLHFDFGDTEWIDM
jgi:hypothetical protein